VQASASEVQGKPETRLVQALTLLAGSHHSQGLAGFALLASHAFPAMEHWPRSGWLQAPEPSQTSRVLAAPSSAQATPLLLAL